MLAGTLSALAPRLLVTATLAVASLLALAAAAQGAWLSLNAAGGLPAMVSGAALRSAEPTPAATSGPSGALAALSPPPQPARWTLQDMPTGDGLGAEDRAHLAAWAGWLTANPSRRITLTLDSPAGAAGPPPARRLAFVVRFLARAGIDPHRVQLSWLPSSHSPATPDLAPILEIGLPN